MVLTQPEDLDVIGLAEDDLEAAFQVFFVRRGRVMGRKGWVVDKVEEIDRAGAGRIVPHSSTWSATRSRRGCWCRVRRRTPT